jgi:hypothetical protein
MRVSEGQLLLRWRRVSDAAAFPAGEWLSSREALRRNRP